MKEKRTSLDDIAKSIGVSKATVSFVLNGKGDEFNISKEKQQLIRDKAKELAYVPNFFAKSLRQGMTKTIGLVLADITNPFYAELCKTIQEELHDNGYNIFIVNTNDNKELEKTMMRELIQRSIDGMIISPCNSINDLIPILHETHIPVVFADRIGDDQADFVGVDSAAEAKRLIEGFSVKPVRLTVLTQFRERVPTIESRITGIQKACAEQQISCEVIDLPGDLSVLKGYVEQELTKGTDAFITLNHQITFQLLTALKQLDVKVPGKVKIISFDDQDAFNYTEPAISALKHPVKKIAVQAVDRMMDRLKESKNPGKHVYLPCDFIARDTH